MKSSHVDAFNRKLKMTIDVVKDENLSRLLSEMSKFKDYYSAADSIGFKYGIEFRVNIIYDDSCNVIGYDPILKMTVKKGIGLIIEELKLSDTVTSAEACYAYLAKEWLYTILRNEAFIKGESIRN